jgi:hypothetical protein
MEGETNGRRDPNTDLEQDLCIHIFTVSSAMLGVCLTVIGLIRVVVTLGRADTVADDFWPVMRCCFWSRVCFRTGRFAPAACAECIAWKKSLMEYSLSP